MRKAFVITSTDPEPWTVLDTLTPLINLERLPVLVVTGDGSRDARQQALTRGADTRGPRTFGPCTPPPWMPGTLGAFFRPQRRFFGSGSVSSSGSGGGG